MWARIKRSIAIWLCPELEKESNYYRRIRSLIDTGKWWLGEFPIAFETMSWIAEEDYNYSRSLDDPVSCKYPGGISQFREYLRRKYKVVS